jgi:hypothetical protein
MVPGQDDKHIEVSNFDQMCEVSAGPETGD